jgi:hypothetical protein
MVRVSELTAALAAAYVAAAGHGEERRQRRDVHDAALRHLLDRSHRPVPDGGQVDGETVVPLLAGELRQRLADLERTGVVDPRVEVPEFVDGRRPPASRGRTGR